MSEELKQMMKQVMEGIVPTAGEYMKPDGNIQVDEIASAVETATSKLKYKLEKTEAELKEAYAEIRSLYKILKIIVDKDY